MYFRKLLADFYYIFDYDLIIEKKEKKGRRFPAFVDSMTN